MFKPFPVFLSFLILFVEPVRAISPLIPPAIVTENTPEEAIDRSIRQVTVRITSDRNRGSGTIIGKNGDNYLVITSAHVIRGATTLQVETHDGQTRSARILPNSLSGDKDLALVEFRDPRDYSIAKISKIPLEAGQHITTAGYSAETGQYTTDDGKIEQMSDRPLREGYSIGYSGEVAQGMSGGGIFYEDELIGINGRSAFPILSNYTYEDGKKPTSAEIQQMRTVNWGIPINTLLTYIRSEILTAYNLPLPQVNPEIETPAYTGYVAELEKKARGFTVRIDSTSGGNGSGVIIAREGKTYTVLTADHVLCEKIAGATTCADFTYTVVTSDGKTRKIEKSTVIRQEGVDLAVFRFQSEETYPIAELGNYTPNTRDVVFVAGYPKIGDRRPVWEFNGGFALDKEGLQLTRQGDLQSQGSAGLPGASSLTGGYELVYTSITYGGMSGGAVLDSSARVIGIHGRAEGGEVGRIQLGFSLGIPIGTFIGLKEKFQTKPSLLTTARAEIDRQQQQELQGALENIKIPATNATAEIWITRGGQLWRLGKLAEAVTAFDRAIAQNRPENVFLAWYGKGMALLYLGQFPGAIDAFQRALATLPVDRDLKNFQASILLWQSVIHNEAGNPESALRTIDRAIALYPQNPNFYGQKHEILMKLKRYDEALKAIDRAIDLAPRSVWYTNRGHLYAEQQKPDLALSDYNKAIEINPRIAEAYSNRGALYYQQQKLDLALSDLNKAIDINSRFALAYVNRGGLYYQQQKLDLALSDLNKAIEINDRIAEAYNNRGVVYAGQQKPDLALSDYNKAIEINDRYADAYTNRGGLYFQQQKFDLALSDLNKAIEINPRSAEAYTNRGTLYYQQQKFDLALSDYNKVIEITPRFAEVYNNRAVLYYQQQKLDLALADYNKAIEINDRLAEAYIGRGYVYYLQQKLDLALSDSNKAIEINDRIGEAYAVRGLVYQQQKRYAEALHNYQKALEFNQKVLVVITITNIGLIHYEQGDLNSARTQFEKALEIEPKFAGNQLALAVTLYRQGDTAKAIELAKSALKIDPEFAKVETLEKNLWGEKIIADTREFLASPAFQNAKSEKF